MNVHLFTVIMGSLGGMLLGLIVGQALTEKEYAKKRILFFNPYQVSVPACATDSECAALSDYVSMVYFNRQNKKG